MTGSQATAAKKVPVRIIHSEEASEKDKCPFLQHNDAAAAAPEPQGLATTRLGSSGTAGRDSPFCAFTRQARDEDIPPAPYADPRTQRDVYMSTGRDHINGSSQQPPPPPPTDQPAAGSCKMTTAAAGTTGLAEEEQKREELARDIMGKDRSLADILDQSKMKTTMDLMEGIFPQGEQLLEGAQQRRKLPAKQAVTRPAEERSVEAPSRAGSRQDGKEKESLGFLALEECPCSFCIRTFSGFFGPLKSQSQKKNIVSFLTLFNLINTLINSANKS